MIATVIMAGGIGKRFWPLSRKSKPKQLLKIFSDKTMIQETIDRMQELTPKERIFLATNKEVADSVKGEVKGINFVLEPFGRDTAACIGLSAIEIMEKLGENAVLVIETADHIVRDNVKYLERLREGIEQAEKGKIVLIGITPDYPETGFGYIHKGNTIENSENIFNVKRFVEKPNKEKAEEYLETGNYLWNSGIFVFRADAMLKEIEKHLPELYKGLMEIKKAGFSKGKKEEVFKELEKISIDYGVLQKTDNVCVVEGNFGWDDIGDYRAMERILEKDNNGNVFKGNGRHIGINSENNVIFSDKLVSTIGINNLVIVESEDSILICRKEDSQKVKEMVKKMENSEEMKKYLE